MKFMDSVRMVLRIPMLPLILVGMILGAAWFMLATGWDQTSGERRKW